MIGQILAFVTGVVATIVALLLLLGKHVEGWAFYLLLVYLFAGIMIGWVARRVYEEDKRPREGQNNSDVYLLPGMEAIIAMTSRKDDKRPREGHEDKCLS